MTFLTLQDAQRIGMEVLPFEQYAPTTEPAQRITPRGHQELALECGAAQSTPRDDDPDPIYKTKIAVSDKVIYVEHYAASGKTFSRNEQYRDQRFWRAENTDNWSGVSVKRPDRTMVGTIRTDKGGQRVEYTEKVYRGGKLEMTIVSACRPILTTAAPQTPPPTETSQRPTLPEPPRQSWPEPPALPGPNRQTWRQPPAPPEPQRQTWPQPDSYETICLESDSGNALNACTRLIDGGQTGFYFWRAQIYFTNGNYDRAIEDLSAFIRLNPNWSALSYYNRGSAYEKKGELEKALTDFREALNRGSTKVSEDINRVEQAIKSLRSKYVVNGLDGLSLGGRVSPRSNEYQEYQCKPSEQFEGVTWCNKQRFEKEPRGLYRSSYTIAHSRDGTICYLNRSQEPAFFSVGEVDRDIEYFSRKFGEQATRVRPHARIGPNTEGIIAIWGKVALEPLDATGTSELAAGRSPRKGVLVDFLGNLSESARRGLDVYRVHWWSWFRLGR
jgi:tetratricopeptide (TPR) repeat protein